MAYDHQTLEQKWQKFWEENKTFKTENPLPHPLTPSPSEKGDGTNSLSFRRGSGGGAKKYILDMFPYPSGAGLHVGHPKGYTATDIVSRYYHAKGYNVLHPMGFDAFGLPAENYAVKTGTHPRITTEANIATFTSQMKALGFSYDWDRMVDTTDPEYYRWTQWIFLELFKRGLAYEAEMPVNWCPALRAVLANEEVVDGKSEIGGHPVEKKLLRQWVLRITEYADRLITDLDALDWPEGIKEMQRNWIGKSEGCEFRLMKSVRPPDKGGLRGVLFPDGLHCSRATEDNFQEILKIRKETGYHTFEFSREQFTVLKKGDAIVGFVRIRKDGNYLEMGALYVLDKFRGHRYGHILIKKALEEVGGDVYIDCNKELESYYLDLGFEKLSAPLPFLLEKNRKVWKSYGEDFTDEQILEKTVYMKMSLPKKPTVLILHGWEGKSDSNWFMSTKETLEQIGYEVIVPDLPNSNTPNIEEQLTFLGQFLSRIDERSIIIGHSLGGQLATKFVELLDKKIKALVLVAPTYPGVAENMGITERTLNDNEKSFVSYVENTILFEKVIQNSILQVLHISENDPYIDFGTVKKYYQQLPGIHTHIYQNKGHFNQEDGAASFPEILENITEYISVYTTRVDTAYGMTYAVLAPDHPKVQEFITVEQREECEQYITESMGRSDQDRTNEGKEKTGVFTGSYVVNPYNGESVPLWIGDFVLGTYGTGAVFGDAHDERDFEFAKKYGIDLKVSILPASGKSEEIEAVKNFEICFTDDGILVNSSECDGLTSSDARRVLAEKAETEGFGHKKVNYKLRDWLFSRQRYWGEPIPLIHISHGDYARLSKSEHAKKSAISYSHGGEGVTRNGDTATKALSHKIIFVDIKEVKKKDKNIEFSEIDVFTKTEKGVIRFIGSDIEKHFSSKNRHELSLRKRLRFSVVQALDSLVYENHECGYFEFRGKIVRVVLKEIGPENFIVKTYYVVGKLTDQYDEFLRTARIVSGHEKETLFIGNKEFSQIYDGLTGKLVIDSALPLLLPEVEKYEPSGDGQSPLATVPEWVNIRLADNLIGRRETNTMPQWGGSCWYYLRYMDAKNPDALASREAMEYWQNIDEYVGGAEHAVLHLLYARFWHKVLYDIGVVPTIEPFQKLTNVGMILAYAYERADGGLVAVDLVEEIPHPNPLLKGEGAKIFVEKSTGNEVKQIVAKMSKSLKNVVNPTDVVSEYGADTLRLYEMSMGAFTDTAPWNTDAIIGVRRFLDRVYASFTPSSQPSPKGEGVSGKSYPLSEGEENKGGGDDMKKMKLLHKTVKKVGEDIVEYKFNTAISALMILLNEGIPTDPEFAEEWREKFLILLHPFAPHMAEELFSLLLKGGAEERGGGFLETREILSPSDSSFQKEPSSIYHAPWPDYDDFMLVDDEVTIAVQVNGKLRGTLTCLNGVMQEEVSSLAHEDPNIFKWIEGKTLVKEIFIPNKMLSIVVKEGE